MNRRDFLAHAGSLAAVGLWANRGTSQLILPPASDKKVAAIVTTYHRYSHADNIVTRFMEGFSIVGKSYPPPCKVASLYIDSQAVKLMGYRGFAKFARGQPATEHALLKLFSSETEQRLYLAGMETLGADGTDVDRPGPVGWREGSWATQYLRSFSGTIAGGTSEIQRNIIAERVLGLPRK